MVGRNGGALALAGFFVAGLLTLLRLTTPFSSGLVRFAKTTQRGCLMATIPTEARALLTISFSADTDFTVLAAYCDKLALALAECDNPALHMAFCGRLATALALLRPCLFDPIPSHLMDSLTVDEPPAAFPRFAPDTNTLCDYCQILVQLLLCRTFPPQMEEQLNWLLSELVEYFAAEINAPRWIRTADGVKFIEEVIA